MENQNLNNTITDDDIKSLLVGIFAFQKDLLSEIVAIRKALRGIEISLREIPDIIEELF